MSIPYGAEESPADWDPETGAVVHRTVDGAAVLDQIAAFLGRFVAFPPHGLTAVTLWAAHAHLAAAMDNTPRLALLSPEPGSGKTRTLEVLELLTPRPLAVLNASAAAIFRTLEDGPATLLLDEADAVFGKRGTDDSAEDLRALLNAGHRRGQTIPRCVGTKHEVQHFTVFAPVALAGLGDLPDTLMTRSVVVRMRRRAPGEHVEPFRQRVHGPDGRALRTTLGTWAASVYDQVSEAWPEMPREVTDRPADVWEPLLAAADAAGGHWPQTARDAAIALVAAAQTTDNGSLGLRLLADLRTVFGVTAEHPGAEKFSSEQILARLHDLAEAPWNELRGKPLDQRGLANRLRRFGVSSRKVDIDGRKLQGYRRDDLWDPWQRYLPPLCTPESPELVEPPEPEPENRRSAHGFSGSAHPEPAATPLELPEPLAGQVPEVPASKSHPEPESPHLTCEVPEVPEVPDLQGDRGQCDRCGNSGGRINNAGSRLCASCGPALFEQVS